MLAARETALLQAERIYKLRQWLDAGVCVTRELVLRELEVSAATYKRDIDTLRDRFNVPLEWDGMRRGWRLDRSQPTVGAQYELPGLWFNAEEIHALLTMQHLLAHLDAGGLLGPHIDPLMKRLDKLLGSGAPPKAEVARRIRVHTMAARKIHLPHFQAVGSALLRRQRLVIEYRGRSRPGSTEREVSPQRLVHYRDNWYLDAWCHVRDALRSFSMDAIERVRVLDATRFRALAALPTASSPHPWQLELAAESTCVNRLVRIPTGFGKTFGVLGAWWWNRVAQRRDDWPRRLVWCLPMRVLVEQVLDDARRALERLGTGDIGVHALMGGAETGEWHVAPEREAVLVGTQDMLLSRAMNRGYGAARARWPMDFGLLNQDCLWVMDEVQLMDVGLATSAQLQAFREQDEARGRSLRPCKTWWMSATLQQAWIEASPDTEGPLGGMPRTSIAAEQRIGPLWDEDKVRKPASTCVTATKTSEALRLGLIDDRAGRVPHAPRLPRGAGPSVHAGAAG